MRFDVISKTCFLHLVCFHFILIITILMCTLSKKQIPGAHGVVLPEPSTNNQDGSEHSGGSTGAVLD